MFVKLNLRHGALNLRHGATALAIACVFALPVRADVVGIGDVIPSTLGEDEFGNPVQVPDLPQFGTEPGDPVIPQVIVGGTGQLVGGTSAGQMTIDIPSDTAPLRSTRGEIGGNAFGFGLVRLVSLNSQWSLTNDLIVGNLGEGTLEVIAGARLTTNDNATGSLAGFDMRVGAASGSQGFVTLDGFASLILNSNLVVGQQSFGSIEVLNRARLETFNNAVIGEQFDLGANVVGTGYVLVEGPGSRWNIGTIPGAGQGQLIVGQLGRGTVEVRDQGLVRVKENSILGDELNAFGEVIVTGPEISGQVSQFWTVGNLTVGALGTGRLEVSRRGLVRTDGATLIGARGLVDMVGGTILTPTFTNLGIVRGDGRIQSPVVANVGNIRTAASVANLRERLYFTGNVDNQAGAIIESIGGEIEIEGETTNDVDAQIYGRDAVLRFRALLTNNGVLVLDNSVLQTTTLSNQGVFQIESRNSSAIEGDLTLAGGVLNMEVGNDSSKLAVTGLATLGGGLDIDLGPGYTPRAGDFWELITASSVGGTFASTSFPPISGLLWDLDYNPTNVILNLIQGAMGGIGADFDGDGDVDGADLAIWRQNVGLMPALQADGDADGDGDVDGNDFLRWQRQVPGPGVPLTPSGAPVPEPGALALAAIALAFTIRARRK